MDDSLLPLNNTALAQLEIGIEELPGAVRRCIEGHQLHEHVQLLSRLKITSLTSQRRLARQVAAIANGAILNGLEEGYLVFDCTGITLGVTGESRERVQITSGDELDVERITQVLSSLLQAHLDPEVRIGVGDYVYQGYGHVRISGVRGAPVFAQKVNADGKIDWMLPVWKFENDWNLGEASPIDAANLFERFLLIRCADFPEAHTPELLGLLQRQSPRTGHELAGFLASILLRAIPAERALAAEAFASVGGLTSIARRLVAQLLTALLHDEPDVAVRAIGSLEQLGDERNIEALRDSLSRYGEDDDLPQMILRCMGELGSRETVTLIRDLYSTFPNGAIQEAADAAIVRLYERHDIPLFVPTLRERFLSQIQSFLYSEAAKTLADSGSRICLARGYRHCLRALVDYGKWRSEFDFMAARKALAQATESELGEDLLERIDYWKNDLPQVKVEDRDEISSEFLVPSDGILADLFFLLDLNYLTDNYAGFASRLYNFIENVAKRLVSDAGFKFAADGKHLDGAWLKENRAIYKYLKRKKNPKGMVDHAMLLTILDMYPTNVQVAEAAGIMRNLKPLIQLRHAGTTGHGLKASTEHGFVEAFNGGFDAIIESVRRLYELATGVVLGENAYVLLNRDLRWILTRSDEIAPSALSLVDVTAGPEV